MSDDWKEALPEALRDAPYIGKAESVDDAVNKLVHAAKLVGTSIRIPSQDASEDDMATFFEKLSTVEGVVKMPLSDDTDGLKALMAKLGTPAEHTAYKLPEMEDFVWDEKIGEDLRKYALTAGLTKDQFGVMAKQIGGQEQAAGATAEESLNDLRKEIRLDWGDTLEDREALIRGWLAKSNAPQELKDSLEGKELTLPTMNWLHAVAKQFKGEVNPISKDGTGGTPPLSIGEALEQIPKIIEDLRAIRETDPRYKPLQEKLVDMHRLAKPDEAA